MTMPVRMITGALTSCKFLYGKSYKKEELGSKKKHDKRNNVLKFVQTLVPWSMISSATTDCEKHKICFHHSNYVFHVDIGVRGC